MSQNVIRFTESDLQEIIQEAVKTALNEEQTGAIVISKQYKNNKGKLLCTDIYLYPTGENQLQGDFEYWHADREDDTYMSGKLYVENRQVVYFSGCQNLPKAVVIALYSRGITTPW